MRIVSTVQEFQELCRKAGRPLGLVPTMGALHEGHLRLVRQARAECATVAASIFVNPTQFGPHEDAERYPRPLKRDLEMLRNESVDMAFVPPVEEVYPPGFTTKVQVAGPALGWEGQHRPGHFDAVATVVAKLLLMALPDLSYFGQKDGQQVAVVRRLITDLHIPTRLRLVPTAREADGLAMSSRNSYFSHKERKAAAVVYRALQAAQQLFLQGERQATALEEACRRVLLSEPLVRGVDYATVVDPDTFAPVSAVDQRPAMLAVAARIGAVRLIDNLLLQP